MKVALVGRDAEEIVDLVKSFGFEIVTQKPDVVISFGGDGTLLSAERQFPSLPKLPIRNSQLCKKCLNHDDKVVLQRLLEGKLQLTEYKKLETTLLYKNFYALNDFVVRNSDSTHTIRFRVTTPLSSLRKLASSPSRSGQESINNLLIGDGIVIATPFGSTGYFKSITGQTFEDGLGVAFNNTTEKIPPLFLKDEDSLTFQLIRGKATLSFDNSPDIFTIDEGSELIFKMSDQVAKIYGDTSLRCPNCEIIRS